jgi:hypothetical protein
MRGVTHVTDEKAELGMLSKQDVLERAFRAIEGLKAKPNLAPQYIPQAVTAVPLPEEPLGAKERGTLVPIACRCSVRPYPHIHSPEDRRRAIAAWNRDSMHKIEPIQ